MKRAGIAFAYLLCALALGCAWFYSFGFFVIGLASIGALIYFQTGHGPFWHLIQAQIAIRAAVILAMACLWDAAKAWRQRFPAELVRSREEFSRV